MEEIFVRECGPSWGPAFANPSGALGQELLHKSRGLAVCNPTLASYWHWAVLVYMCVCIRVTFWESIPL